MNAAPFRTVVHADWSMHPAGRWWARAVRDERGWRAEAPTLVPRLAEAVAELFAAAAGGPVLAGFDHPIGLPVGYGRTTGLADFPTGLAAFGTGDWAGFYDVAVLPHEIGRFRPFYPARPGGTRRQHLLDGHGVDQVEALTRRCERGGPGTKAAGCLFWTLGAQQVGRAALVGWREVVEPARRRGASLWPFDGDLAGLALRGGLTLAETYPADGYGRLGAPFRPAESKRRQGDRARKAAALEGWAAAHAVILSPCLTVALRDGFGAEDRGGDRFDAVIGLLALLDCLVSGQTGAPPDEDIRRWEGWIMGRPWSPAAR